MGNKTTSLDLLVSSARTVVSDGQPQRRPNEADEPKDESNWRSACQQSGGRRDRQVDERVPAFR